MEFDKSKVYTALNADEVKVGSKGFFADCIDTLKAFVTNGDDFDVLEEIGPEYDSERFKQKNGATYLLFYLVEEPEEEKYRPYENTDEMIEDFKERARAYGAYFSGCPMFNPTIWVKDKERNNVSLIALLTGVCSQKFICLGDVRYELKTLLENFTYLDGTPCGKKIEE